MTHEMQSEMLTLLFGSVTNAMIHYHGAAGTGRAWRDAVFVGGRLRSAYAPGKFVEFKQLADGREYLAI